MKKVSDEVDGDKDESFLQTYTTILDGDGQAFAKIPK